MSPLVSVLVLAWAPECRAQVELVVQALIESPSESGLQMEVAWRPVQIDVEVLCLSWVWPKILHKAGRSSVSPEPCERLLMVCRSVFSFSFHQFLVVKFIVGCPG